MYDAIEVIARQAGALALTHFERMSGLAIDSKGHLDLVTEADRAVEAFIAARLAEAFPDDGIFGEEGSAVAGTSGRTWIIDPIDGTFNFVRKGDQWAVSIGLFANGRPEYGVVHAPLRGETLVGGRGLPARLNNVDLPKIGPLDRGRGAVGVGFHPVIPVPDRTDILNAVMADLGMTVRWCGSAVISLMEIATGQTDGYIGSGESSWDVMGILPALEAVGAVSTIDWATTDLTRKIRFACGKPDFLALVPPGLLKPVA
jgi:myo-inositol-1(or 4)-monophosphatase